MPAFGSNDLEKMISYGMKFQEVGEILSLLSLSDKNRSSSSSSAVESDDCALFFDSSSSAVFDSCREAHREQPKSSAAGTVKQG